MLFVGGATKIYPACLYVSAGIEQGEDMKRFLWCVGSNIFLDFAVIDGHYRNNHFAAIASDQPALEARTKDLKSLLLLD